MGVAIKQRYPGHAKQAGHVARQCQIGAYAGKYVVVTDEDVDVSDLEELIWAILPRTTRDIYRYNQRCLVDASRPSYFTGRQGSGNLTNSRAIIDACRPFH